MLRRDKKGRFKKRPLRGSDGRFVSKKAAPKTKKRPPSKKAAPKAPRARRTGEGGFSLVFKRIKKHLDGAGRANWRLELRKPKRFWEWRGRYIPSGPEYYDNVWEAWIKISDDGVIDRAMAGHSMSVLIRVHDYLMGRDLWFTAAAASHVDVAMDDVLDKLSQWKVAYGKPPDNTDPSERDEASTVRELVILIR